MFVVTLSLLCACLHRDVSSRLSSIVLSLPSRAMPRSPNVVVVQVPSLRLAEEGEGESTVGFSLLGKPLLLNSSSGTGGGYGGTPAGAMVTPPRSPARGSSHASTLRGHAVSVDERASASVLSSAHGTHGMQRAHSTGEPPSPSPYGALPFTPGVVGFGGYNGGTVAPWG